MKNLALALLLAPLLAYAQQTTPPAPAAPRSVNIPQPVEKTLANGLRVIVIPKHDVPLVQANLLIRSGSEEDAPGFEGLASMTSSLLTKGTKTRTAEQIARGVEALGATLQSSAGWDASGVELNTMSTKLGDAMVFMGDVVRNPTFAQEELDRFRQQVLDGLSVELREPGALARIVASRVVFGGAPYGHTVSGLPESVNNIKRENVIEFHKAYYRPNNAVLVIGGDVKPAAAFALAEKTFGGWKNPSGVMGKVEKIEANPLPPRVVVIDMPDAGQASVLVARQGLKRVDPLFYTAIVTNSILGGGYSSRLNQEIRIKRGLSYGASSNFDLRRDVGPFVASAGTKNESADEVAGIILDEIRRLGETDVVDSELTPRKAVLIGGFGRSLETSGGIVSRVGTLALHGLPLDEIKRYISNVEKVSAADVRKFAGKSLGGNANIIIVGNAKEFIEPIRAKFPNVEVIPIGELDLTSPTLRKKS